MNLRTSQTAGDGAHFRPRYRPATAKAGGRDLQAQVGQGSKQQAGAGRMGQSAEKIGSGPDDEGTRERLQTDRTERQPGAEVEIGTLFANPASGKEQIDGADDEESGRDAMGQSRTDAIVEGRDKRIVAKRP